MIIRQNNNLCIIKHFKHLLIKLMHNSRILSSKNLQNENDLYVMLFS